MIQKNSNPSYVEINIKNFFSMGGRLPFDVYVSLGGSHYTKIFHANTELDRDRFLSYQDRKIDNLYIQSRDRHLYVGATEVLVQKLISEKSLLADDSIQAIDELCSQTLSEIFSIGKVDQHAIRRASIVVQSYVTLVKEDVRTLAKFLSLARKESYYCRHSISTAIFSVLLARATGTDEKLLMTTGLAGLLHDVGMTRLPEELDEHSQTLSANKRIEIGAHPMYSTKLLEGAQSVSEPVQKAILQHHETWDGLGYPHRLKGPQIELPARILAIADCFSGLTSQRPGRERMTPNEALMCLAMGKKVDPELLAMFSKLLKPKTT